MLLLIESMRILRAKIASLGGVAPRSCPHAIGPDAAAQSPAIVARRSQRHLRCPLITNTSVQHFHTRDLTSGTSWVEKPDVRLRPRCSAAASAIASPSTSIFQAAGTPKTRLKLAA